MARLDEPGGMRIGDVLKRARTRQGLEMRTVEERTKIRIKYLRALEGEDWDLLPSSAYAKGFLRTYAELLGLDGDALVDEYRRRVESELSPGQPYPLTEPVLEGRRRPGGGAGPPWGLIAVVGAGVIALLLVLAITGGDGEDRGKGAGKRARQERRERQERKEERLARQRREAARADSAVTLRLEINSGVSVCLIGDSGQPLIDDQLLNPGTQEGPYEARSFELRFPSGYDRGQFELFVAGKPKRLPELSGPAAFRILPPRRVRQVEAPVGACP